MAKMKKAAQVSEAAALGAQTQLRELLHQAKLLIDLFPHLRDSFDKDELPVSFILKQGRDRARARARKPTRRVSRK